MEDSIHNIFCQVMKLHFLKSSSYLEKYGIYPGQAGVLHELRHENGQSQRELAKNMQVTPATVTVMLQRMEKIELIIREQDKTDKRVSRIYITEKGKNISKKLEVVRNKIEKECLENFKKEEKIQLKDRKSVV